MDDWLLGARPRPLCMETGGGRAPAGLLTRVLRRSARYAAVRVRGGGMSVTGQNIWRVTCRPPTASESERASRGSAYRIVRSTCRRETAASLSSQSLAPWSCCGQTWRLRQQRVQVQGGAVLVCSRGVGEFVSVVESWGSEVGRCGMAAAGSRQPDSTVGSMDLCGLLECLLFTSVGSSACMQRRC